MKKTSWEIPELWELNIENTEFGGSNPANIDGSYVEMNDQKYWPSAS